MQSLGKAVRDMTVRITILSEDKASFRCLGEFGLSMLIETDDYTLLMDTGMGETLIRNKKKLGVRFRQLSGVVLSHGHLDHTGGLGSLVDAAPGIEIFHHPGVFERRFSTSRGDKRDISLPFNAEALRKKGARLTQIVEPTWLTDTLVLSGPVPMHTDFETIERTLFVERNGDLVPDPFDDELAVAVETPKGLIVALGCAHRGPVNTILHFQDLTGCDTIRAVVGGTHLTHADATRIDRTLSAMAAFNPRRLACCHCTGRKGEAAFAGAFGERFVHVSAGSQLIFS